MPLLMYTLTKTVQAPYLLPPAIEMAITEYTATPSRKRCKSSSPPPSSPSSSSSPLSPSTSPSPSPSPSPSSSPSPSLTIIPPRKRFKMSSSHQDTTTEAITPARLHRSSIVAHILPVTSEPFQYTIPLLVAKIIRHKGQIHKIFEVLLEDTETRLEAREVREIELRARVRTLEDRIGPAGSRD
ncbi:hypothetical protein Tco_1549878 [Tanacetum coccineum]